MKALPPRPYDTAQLSLGKVDKYGCVSVDTNHYSVPDHLVGQTVEVRAYADELRLHARFGAGELLARHTRLRTRHQWVIELDHFLPTLRRKPGALPGSAAWKQAEPRLRDFHERHFATRPRRFVDLLIWARDEGAKLTDLIATADRLLALRPHLPVDPDAIRASLREQWARPRAVSELAERVRGEDQGTVPATAPLSVPSTAPASAPSSDVINTIANAQLAQLQQLLFHSSTTPS